MLIAGPKDVVVIQVIDFFLCFVCLWKIHASSFIIEDRLAYDSLELKTYRSIYNTTAK